MGVPHLAQGSNGAFDLVAKNERAARLPILNDVQSKRNKDGVAHFVAYLGDVVFHGSNVAQTARNATIFFVRLYFF